MSKLDEYVKDSHHGDQVHISGCPGAIYLAGECSTACKNATRNLNLTREEIQSLPYASRRISDGTGRGDSMG